MKRTVFIALGIAAVSATLAGQKKDAGVSTDMLVTPPPNDWLMYSRTYDAQRYSPLEKINKQNAGQLRMAWTRGLAPGTMEGIPLVHDGVMYVIAPAGSIEALDATNGDLIWEYKHKMAPGPNGQTPNASSARSK